MPTEPTVEKRGNALLKLSKASVQLYELRYDSALKGGRQTFVKSFSRRKTAIPADFLLALEALTKDRLPRRQELIERIEKEALGPARIEAARLAAEVKRNEMTVPLADAVAAVQRAELHAKIHKAPVSLDSLVALEGCLSNLTALAARASGKSLEELHLEIAIRAIDESRKVLDAGMAEEGTATHDNLKVLMVAFRAAVGKHLETTQTLKLSRKGKGDGV